MECVNQFCRRPRDRSKNGVYCEDHVCSWPDCLSPRSTGECCRAHTCFREDCSARRQHGAYCERHQCQDTNCTNAQQQGLHCFGHQPNMIQVEKCVNGDCANPRHGALPVCKEHHMCSDPRCRSVAMGDASVCMEHKCRAYACDERVEGGQNIYCGRHVCRWCVDHPETVPSIRPRAFAPHLGGRLLDYCELRTESFVLD